MIAQSWIQEVGKPTVKVISTAMLLVASLCAHAQGVLNVANFSDYIGPEVIKKFEKATGIKVNYGIIDSDDTLQAKLLSGRSGYDVVYPSNNYFAKQVEAGIFEKLDWSKLPNRSGLDPMIMKQAAASDPGNRYGVPYTYGEEGLVVNLTKVKEILGSEPALNSYDLLFKPEFASKLQKCGIALIDSTSNYQTMLAYMGRDPNSTKMSDFEDANKELMKIRPFVKLFSYSTINDFAAGDICLATGWTGDVAVMKRRAKEAGRNYDIRFVAPKGQSGFWLTMMGIPKDAANKEAAYKWMNFMLDPDIAAETANHITYPTTVIPAKAKVKPELVNDPLLYPSETKIAEFFSYYPWDEDLLRATNKIWLRYKSGR